MDTTEDLPQLEQELFEHFHFNVDKGQAPLRLDVFLTSKMADTSRNRIQMAAAEGYVLVNGRPAKSNYKVKPLDQISIVLPFQRHEYELCPENIPLHIVYEDDALLVVNKPAGMTVHPAPGNYTGTLINALAWHFGARTPLKDTDPRMGVLVHRIDKDTSGLLVIAKTDAAQFALAKQFFNHSVRREYTALVWGDMDAREGTIEGNIGRHPNDRLRFCVCKNPDDGKPAVTHWKVLERFGYVTAVQCRLETGRTHQIRVHMSHTGHPLFNDARYGGSYIRSGTSFTKFKQFVDNCFAILPRQALHAKTLGFIHPSTGKEVFFDSDLPQDMVSVIEKWRRYGAAGGIGSL